jgi:hypothetical protein
MLISITPDSSLAVAFSTWSMPVYRTITTGHTLAAIEPTQRVQPNLLIQWHSYLYG